MVVTVREAADVVVKFGAHTVCSPELSFRKAYSSQRLGRYERYSLIYEGEASRALRGIFQAELK